jgi:hypothetical protein
MTLLDQWLPEYQFVERHQRLTAAAPAALWQALHHLTARDVPLLRRLMWLRSLPHLLGGARGQAFPAARPLLDSQGFFVTLAQEPGREWVAGLAGQFWRPAAVPVRLADAAAFRDFHQAGFAKAAVNFRLESGRITTETRIWALDESARRRFAWYWRLIRPGSGWIRHEWLRAVERKALSDSV